MTEDDRRFVGVITNGEQTVALCVCVCVPSCFFHVERTSKKKKTDGINEELNLDFVRSGSSVRGLRLSFLQNTQIHVCVCVCYHDYPL